MEEEAEERFSTPMGIRLLSRKDADSIARAKDMKELWTGIKKRQEDQRRTAVQLKTCITTIDSGMLKNNPIDVKTCVKDALNLVAYLFRNNHAPCVEAEAKLEEMINQLVSEAEAYKHEEPNARGMNNVAKKLLSKSSKERQKKMNERRFTPIQAMNVTAPRGRNHQWKKGQTLDKA